MVLIPSEDRIAYLEKLMDERDKRYAAQFIAQEKALGVALAAKHEVKATVMGIVAILLSLISLAMTLLLRSR